jgi:dolichol-phosphate mannosyltransferase
VTAEFPQSAISSEMKTLSIVVPVYYNEESLRPLFDALMQVDAELRKRAVCLQLIFVDDGSGDGSLRELLEIASGNESVKVVKNSRNFGAMMALKTGFQFVEATASPSSPQIFRIRRSS